MKAKPIIAVWFSCGAASAVAAKKTIERFGTDFDVRIVNSPVKEEDEDNRRFLMDVERWLGRKIEIATNPKYPECSAVEVWEDRQYVSGVAGAPCTLELKKEARYEWERINKPKWHVMGFTADEMDRHWKFIVKERPNVLPVLIVLGITKANCFEIIKDAGIELPRIYKLGYPNANCIGCVKSSSPTYWNLVRKRHPEVFKHRAEQSERIGARLVEYKEERIFLSQLTPEMKGGKIKGMEMECGIFCDTK